MRKDSGLFIFIIALSLVLSNNINAQFQPSPVEKSNQKVIIEGKTYYLHSIKPKQTLHGICKTYGVSIQEISEANPNISLNVIRPDQILKIPSPPSEQISNAQYKKLSENDFIYHKIEQQQTVFYLSKKYNIPKEVIYKYNPGSEEVIQIGQILKIPKPGVQFYGIPQPESADSSTYTVKKGDTLYSLARLYGISIADIILLNPDLRWGLKTGMLLKIPGLFDQYVKTDSLIMTDEPLIKQFTLKQCDSVFNQKSNQPIKVVLLLPFQIDKINNLNSIKNDSLKKHHTNRKYANIGNSFIEYYQGFLLALDSLKKQGQNISLFTYDTKSDTNEIIKIIKELDIIMPDLIIGPVYSNNIKKVSRFSMEMEIPLILPVTRNNSKVVDSNPYAVTMLPDMKTELDICANYISQFKNRNIVLIHNQDSLRMKNINYFTNKLSSFYESNTGWKDSLYTELRINDNLTKALNKALKSNKDNIVIIFSTNEAFVSDIVSQLSFKSKYYSIQLLGLPIWQQFNNLRIEQLHTLNAIIYSPFYIDYSKPQTIGFIKNSRKNLGYEPYKKANGNSGFNFAYLGYETGLLFINAYNKYETNFINCVCNLNEVLPQNNYVFKLSKSGSYVNYSINFIEFKEDYSVERVNFTPSSADASKRPQIENNNDFESIEF